MPYRLEQVVPRRSQIYRQMTNYYNFCEQTRRMSRTTMQSKVYILNSFVRESRLTDLRKITNRQVYDWIDCQTRRGNTGRSINDRLAHLKAMLRWQQDMSLPMPGLRLGLIAKVREVPARKVCFSRAEVERALAGADPETWLMIRLAFDCGLRISELRNLQLSDFQGSRLTIIGKGSKRRYAYLSDEVQQKLQDWTTYNNIVGYLWPSPLSPDQPLAVCTVRQKMRAAFQAAGLPDFCPHDLRHSYATDLKQLGIPTRQIQAGLGHATEAVTERYLSDLDGFDLYEVYRQKYAATAK